MQFSVNPSTTRVLHLFDFSTELKTRDIAGIFAPFEAQLGGFKIKWINDNSAYIVFADPSIAKRAFLSLSTGSHPLLRQHQPDDPNAFPKLLPYNGPDVQDIIQSVATRPRARSTSQSTPTYNNGAPSSPASKVASGSPSLQRTALASMNGVHRKTLPEQPEPEDGGDAFTSSGSDTLHRSGSGRKLMGSFNPAYQA